MKRGDVVLAGFPFQDVPGSKVGPAVVVQNDADNQALANTILATITGNLADAGRATNVLVDPATPDGAGSGLHGPGSGWGYRTPSQRGGQQGFPNAVFPQLAACSAQP
jgi:hypothetical protein